MILVCYLSLFIIIIIKKSKQWAWMLLKKTLVFAVFHYYLIIIIIQNGLSVFMRLIDLQFSWKHFAIILFQCTIILLSNSTYDSSNIFEINNKFILPSFIVISIAYFLVLNYFLILEFLKKIVMKIVHLWQMRKSLVHSFGTGDEVAENLVIKVPL